VKARDRVRARRSAQEWARLVKEWRRSGLPGREFAALHDVGPGTLSWWRWRLRGKAESSSPLALRLVPLQVEPAPSAMREGSCWELVTAGGHVLRVHGEIAGCDLAAVLAALKLGGGRR
jgi:hypothetical protein